MSRSAMTCSRGTLEKPSRNSQFNASTLRRVITFTRSHVCVFDAANLDRDLPVLAVAIFIRWVVTQTVLRPDFVGDRGKRGARLAQASGAEVFAARPARQIAHLATRQGVKSPADVHAFERSQPAKILIVLLLRAWRKQAPEPLQLFRRQREAAVVL